MQAWRGHSGHGAAVPNTLDDAEGILRLLAPGADAGVFQKLGEEGVQTAADLACLDKEDLRHIGLRLVECGRVLAWARRRLGNELPSDELHRSTSLPKSLLEQEPASPRMERPELERSTSMDLTPLGVSSAMLDAGMDRDSSTHMWAWANAPQEDFLKVPPAPAGELIFCRGLSGGEEDECRHKLDDIAQQADFWCNLVAQVQLGQALTDVCADVRENMLEELFDVTPERVAEVYAGMISSRSSGSPRSCGCVLEAELGEGLARFGLVGFTDAALAQVFKAMSVNRKVGLSLAEFDAILSRMKLAQLLVRRSEPAQRLKEAGTLPLRLIAVDFNAHHQSRTDFTDDDLRDFFFKNRAVVGPQPLVRWVHMCDFDMISLLALTVKYSLHPLGVEDVIEQCPTKIDRYGSHFFVAMEQLSLDGPVSPQMPVRVAGFHLSLFCCGPPLHDTIVTISQPDRSFAGDWPHGGGSMSLEASPAGDALAKKLRRRLMAPRSRLRERRADFIMYHAVDLCVDELFAVTRAYAARLQFLEGTVNTAPSVAGGGKDEAPDCSGEASQIRMQLQVVVRRIRGLQRMVRQLLSDSDLTANLGRYLQDVSDHLDEAYEDAVHLADRSMALITAHRRAVERCLEAIRQRSSDRLSMILFILTVGTFVFAPMQFLAGVYGMNFVHGQEPGIPELEWTNGYAFFWLAIGLYLVLLSVVSTICYCGVRRKTDSDKELQQSLDTQAALLPGLH